jgi:hypothetical protein
MSQVQHKLKEHIKQYNEEKTLEYLIKFFYENPEFYIDKSILFFKSPVDMTCSNKDLDFFYLIYDTFLKLNIEEDSIRISKIENSIFSYFFVFDKSQKNINKINKIFDRNINFYDQILSFVNKFNKSLKNLKTEPVKDDISQVTSPFVANYKNSIGLKTSLYGAIEGYMEQLDRLLGYCFFNIRTKSIIFKKDNNFEQLSENQLVQISFLSAERLQIEELWDKIVFFDWRLSKSIDSKTKKEIFFCRPLNKIDEKIKFINVTRELYNANKDIIKKLPANDFIVYDANVKKFIKELKTQNSFDAFFTITREVYFSDFFNYSKSISDIAYSKVDLFLKDIDLDGYKINDIFCIVEYMYNIAYFLENFFLDSDIDLTFNKNDLVKHISDIYKMSTTKVENILNEFIYDGSKGKDVFSSPLIKFGNEVFINPRHINQLNITRTVDFIIRRKKKLVDKKGLLFQDYVKLAIETCEGLNVNQNKCKYTSTIDGKEIEIDCIVEFDNHIFIIDFKNFYKTFDYRERKNCYNSIIYPGAEQLDRIQSSIINEWEIFEKYCKINFNKKVYLKKDITKIICLNNIEFTGLQVDDCYVIDYYALLTYLTNYEERFEIFKPNGEITKLFENKIRENELNSVEFINYLKDPKPLVPFKECIKEDYYPIISFDEMDNIYVNCFIFTYNYSSDPMNSYISRKANKTKINSDSKKNNE